MNIDKLSRIEKENLYKEKMTALQRLWQNPIDDEWDFDGWTNEQLDKGLQETIHSLRFEKMCNFFNRIVLFIAGIVTIGFAITSPVIFIALVASFFLFKELK